MRLLQFRLRAEDHNSVYFGAELGPGGDILPLPAAKTPFSLLYFIRAGPGVWETARVKVRLAELSGSPEVIARDQVILTSPITNISKILGIGLNYKDGAAELKKEIPKRPIVFLKLPSTIMGPEDDLILPKESAQVDWEVELGVVIGKGGRWIPREEALQHVFGFTVAVDYTARDLVEKNGGLWTLAKNFPGFCPLGPAVVTKDELKDFQNLGLTTTVYSGGLLAKMGLGGQSGDVMQASNTSNMIFGVEDLVSYVSQFMELTPGDLILTGTPAGTGAAVSPPVFLRKGDTVKCEIEKIGTVQNKII